MSRCAVSIDVDPVSCYYRIHALGPAPERLRHTIMHRCVPRFAEVFERRGIRATFFVVGNDLDDPAGDAGVEHTRELVRDLARRGHEIGNHSLSHAYDLARLDEATVAREIERAHELLQAVVGESIVGFRAPGYDISATMLAQLERLGYRYDSSVFPAPGYYAAKAAVMAALALVGKRSGAVMTDPRALLAPSMPYRPDVRAPWRRGRSAVVELPISVTPRARIPAIGTSLLLAPGWLSARLIRSMTRREFFNFELHGIDLADAEDDALPAELRARQPDLRLPLVEKLRRFEAMLDVVEEGFDEFVLLRQQAAISQRDTSC